jgi:putative nucleotidyltransferase with HDIG domain
MHGARAFFFSKSLDRTALLASFLGAVVPFAVLGIAAERFAFPYVDETTRMAGLAGIASLAVLSLGAFLALRRAARGAITRMQGDNDRLETLLEAAGALSKAHHAGSAAETLARAALRLIGARTVTVLVRDEKGTALVPVAHDGPGAAAEFSAREAEWLPHAEAAIEQERPTVLGERSDGGAAITTAILPLGARARPGGAIVATLARPERELSQPEIGALSTLVGLGAVALQNADLHEVQRNFFAHVTDILVSAVDSHLDYHRGHARAVAYLTNRIARELGFEGERLERLHFAALFHDVGMLRIPRDHPDAKGARAHPTLGHRMLAPIRAWQEVAQFVLHHHEWWNGHGYPEGLAGEAIPLESRIIALAEALDSMTSPSSYKPAVSREEALRRIADGSGTQFDPTVVEAFQKLVARGEIEVVREG